MICEECGEEVDGNVCKNCGLVIDIRPIAQNLIPLTYDEQDDRKTIPINHDTWEYPLAPKIRKIGKDFNLRYQKVYKDTIYIKAYESISKLCASLKLSQIVKYEALNLFKGIRLLDPYFFRSKKLAPTYLACIKIACKIHDFPIQNYELANVIDYKLNANKNINFNYMEKKFNKAYRSILKLYNLRIISPEHPNFIDYACETLDFPYKFTKEIHEKYSKMRKYFQPHFKIEGYILALIYIFGYKEYNLTLKILAEKFHISSLTISSRKNEIVNRLEYEKNKKK